MGTAVVDTYEKESGDKEALKKEPEKQVSTKYPCIYCKNTDVLLSLRESCQMSKASNYRLNSMNKKYPATIYGKEILIEVPVQLCISDFLREGGCAFDAGANVGSISVAMSRMVGAKGKVFSFEANPFILPRLKTDLDANNCGNVKIVPKAVWSESYMQLPFYCENSYNSASSSLLKNLNDSTQVQVETISLDDLCAEEKAIPDVIKIDVEGAEYQALQGAIRILKEHAPVIALEYHPSCPVEEDPIIYLNKLGYIFVDTNLYEPVQREYYHARYAKPICFNVLAIPEKKWKNSPYESISFTHKATIDISNSKFNNNSAAPLSHQPVRLNPGRYMAIFDFDGPDVMTGSLSVTSNEGFLIMYEAKLDLLKTHACANMVFEIDKPQKIQCHLTNNADRTFVFRSIKIMEIQLGFTKAQSSETGAREVYNDMAASKNNQVHQVAGKSHFNCLKHNLDVVYFTLRRWAINNLRDKSFRIWRLAKSLSKWYWKIRKLLG